MADLLAAALEYADAGIAVFPARVSVVEGRKVVQPVGRWRDASSTSPAQLRDWFGPGRAWSDASLCIDTGKSALVVVDLDVTGGHDGITAWGALMAEHDIEPSPVRVRTPSGGEHWFYREHPRRVVGIDSSGKVAPGVDIRGLGGFVIAWPSEDARGPYVPIGPESYAPSLASLPTVPDVVVERMNPRSTVDTSEALPRGSEPLRDKGSATAKPSIWDEFPHEFTRAEAVKFCRPAFAALRGARDGEINHRLNDAAITIGHFVPAFWSREHAVRILMDALSETVYDGRTWRAEATIASGLRGADWHAVEVKTPENPLQRADGASESDAAPSRRVDLTPWLDGTWKPPQPSHGAMRDDGRTMLYPGRWHTLVGPNESGKTWLELVHAREEMLNRGRVVVMAHFEEALPGGTVARLLAMGLPPELLARRFVWLACDRQWRAGDLAAELDQVEGDIGLVILDGINAACTSHGQDPLAASTVGWYRTMFVAPAARRGAAVLSAGHPVKARDRQDERHGFGSTAWLDEVDGVAFRLVPGKEPIRKGMSGTAAVHVVKDRYGEVSGLAVGDQDGWRYVASIVVDDTPGATTRVRLSAPSRPDTTGPADAIDGLAGEVVRVLGKHGDRYPSNRTLGDWLRADRVTFNDRDLAPALERLQDAGRLERGEPEPKRPWPGRLVPAVPQDHEDSDE